MRKITEKVEQTTTVEWDGRQCKVRFPTGLFAYFDHETAVLEFSSPELKDAIIAEITEHRPLEDNEVRISGVIHKLSIECNYVRMSNGVDCLDFYPKYAERSMWDGEMFDLCKAFWEANKPKIESWVVKAAGEGVMVSKGDAFYLINRAFTVWSTGAILEVPEDVRKEAEELLRQEIIEEQPLAVRNCICFLEQTRVHELTLREVIELVGSFKALKTATRKSYQNNAKTDTTASVS